MLVLTRKLGESIQIGENIRCTILSVQGRSIKVGISAPKEISVYRSEVYDEVVEENRRAVEAVNRENLKVLADLGFKKITYE